MKISFLCVLIAGLLPYLGTMAAKWGFRRYDNHNPRQWLGEQTGFRARGNAAQANSFEAFPFLPLASSSLLWRRWMSRWWKVLQSRLWWHVWATSFVMWPTRPLGAPSFGWWVC